MEGCAGESAAKISEKNISVIFLKLIFFGGLVAGKSAAKKTLKNISFIYIFLEGWSRENWRQKTGKKYKFYFFKTYIFGRAGRGKIGGKKN